MEVLAAVELLTRLADLVANAAATAQQVGAIVAAAQKEGRPFTDAERAALRAIDDQARDVLDAAIARASAPKG